MTRPMPAPPPHPALECSQVKGPGSCWEGTGFFKAAFESIGSQVQPGEQGVSYLRGKVSKSKQLILMLVTAKPCNRWQDLTPSASGLSVLSCQMRQ